MAQASADKLEGPAEKERVASVLQRKHLVSTPEPLLPKEKKKSHQSRSPDREVGESQGEREPHLGEGEGDWSGSTERKG